MAHFDSFSFDGLRVPVEIHEGPDRPLLYLPGYGVHPRNYRPGMRLLSRHFTVFMPDLSFRTNKDLPVEVAAYRSFVIRFATRYAPEAPRTGHSFGGLLALLGDRPAVALAPMVPINAGWPRKIGRAALLQVREYAGLEGRRGIGWAFHIFGEYVRTAAARPRCLFPAVSETLGGIPDDLLPTAPRSVLVLARRDRLYLQREYDAYLARSGRGDIETRYVSRGHDWPVTHPDLVEREVLAALGKDARVLN
ncbi:MAG: alpha/beta hydrolase [marine benthic group bacterium]|nr:alpha/beta hydrolase [Gemmatimonadota bacterium]MCL7970026.1 alpha/beta hydrolase [Gemmatimonadota bacterium]MCL7985718.1 alpha/beta hydrolase [Gemmatimonadota bacterium]MCL7989972.1 alpha/beta hydrolase [Gemmatimonadota bacterium]